jgi:hypothetical protein
LEGYDVGKQKLINPGSLKINANVRGTSFGGCTLSHHAYTNLREKDTGGKVGQGVGIEEEDASEVFELAEARLREFDKRSSNTKNSVLALAGDWDDQTADDNKAHEKFI